MATKRPPAHVDREEDAPGEEHAEFEQVRHARRLFDFAAWNAALETRAQMPVWTSATNRSRVPGDRGRGRTRLVVLDGEGGNATARRVKSSHDSPLEVALLTVSAKEGFVAGTLVVPVTEDEVSSFELPSLALFHWNEQAEEYELVHDSGLDVAGGYVSGRITDAGRYAILGLPTDAKRLAQLEDAGRPELLRIIGWIFTRLFDPSGPWRSLGPFNLSCCMMDVAVDPADSNRLYAAASDGGVWRLDSVSGYPGVSWLPLTDGQPSLQVQCLAVSPADSRVVYYVDAWGSLRRSPDRGETWTTPGTTTIGTAQRMLAHPSDVNTVWVATSTGLWCTHDGGSTWASSPGQTTLRDGDMTDVALDPADPSIIYLTQRNTGLLKSANGGLTWQTMLPWSRANMPSGTEMRVAVGRGGTDATRTVAVRFDQEVLVNRRGGRDVTMLGGGAWTSTGKVGGTGYGWWCHVLAIDPFDDQVMLSGGQELCRTANGGTSWSTVITYYAPHEDQHRVVFDATQAGVVYAANDGGVFRSPDGGQTWNVDEHDVENQRDLTHGLATAQFYRAAVSGDHAMGDLYHQGIAAADSLRVGTWEGVEGHSWEFNNVYGDSAHAGTYYVFGGQLFRRDFPGGALVAISTFTPTAVMAGPGGSLLAGANDGTMRRTDDPTIASPVWTTMAGLSTPGDNVVAIAVAPSNPTVAYAVTGGGRVFRCGDLTVPTAWTARTSLPAGGVAAVAVSHESADVVFVATAVGVHRSPDAGGSWTGANGTTPNSIPPGAGVRSLVTGPGALYAGASVGVFTSSDRGVTWYDFSAGLPNVQLMHLLWTENDLFAVTHGRGIWHHGRYDAYPIPGPVAHKPDIAWLIELWHRIHGGDPGPEALRKQLGRSRPAFRAGRGNVHTH